MASKKYYVKIMDKEPKEIPEIVFNHLFRDFECLVRTYLLHINKPVWEDLVSQKYGLKDGIPRTSAEIGRHYNFTRERARQILFLILHDLKKLIDGKSLRSPRIFCDPSKYPYKAFIEGLRGRSLLTLSQVIEVAQEYSGGVKEIAKNQIDFLMAVLGYNASQYEGVELYYKDQLYAAVLKKIFQFKRYLKNEALFVAKQDIQKNAGIAQDELEFFLGVTGNILENKVLKGVQYYRVSLKELNDSELAVYRILYEHGSSMHIKEIKKRMIAAGRPFTQASNFKNLKNRMRPIGKSGMWVLEEWEMETSPVWQVIERVLKEEGKPLSGEEIMEKVSMSRPVDEKSIKATLYLRTDLFDSYKNKKYGLKNWKLKIPLKIKGLNRERSKPSLREEIVKNTVKVLKKHKGKMLMKDLVALLLKDSCCATSLIYGALNGRTDLFEKGPVAGSRGRVILLK